MMEPLYPKLVAEFQEKMGTSKDPKVLFSFVEEELKEFKEAAEHLLKEYVDIIYTCAGYINVVGEEKGANDLEALLSEAGPALSSIAEALSEDPKVIEEAFKRVHASNMSKLGDDGKPVYREDGKVTKGPNYKAPDLSDLLF